MDRAIWIHQLGAVQSSVAILADHRHGHPRILPRRYFLDLEVERGSGAATAIRFRMRMFGTVRAEIHEPAPGRTLVETDVDSGAVTVFTVAPSNGGRSALVTIAMEWIPAGWRGQVERLLAPPMLRRVYAAELEQLAREVRDQREAAPPG